MLPHHLLADTRLDGELPGSSCTDQKLILVYILDLDWKLCQIPYRPKENVCVQEDGKSNGALKSSREDISNTPVANPKLRFGL